MQEIAERFAAILIRYSEAAEENHDTSSGTFRSSRTGASSKKSGASYETPAEAEKTDHAIRSRLDSPSEKHGHGQNNISTECGENLGRLLKNIAFT
jgi:hypothetical protein